MLVMQLTFFLLFLCTSFGGVVVAMPLSEMHSRVCNPFECFYGMYKAEFDVGARNTFQVAFSESNGPQRVSRLSGLWEDWHHRISTCMSGKAAPACLACLNGAHWDKLVPALLGLAPEKFDEVTAAVLVSSNPQLISLVESAKSTSAADTYIVKEMDTLKTQGLHNLYTKGNYDGLRAAILNAHNELSTCKNPPCHPAPRCELFHCVLRMRINDPNLYKGTTNEFTRLFRMDKGLLQANSIASVWDDNQFPIRNLMKHNDHTFSDCQLCTWDAVIPLYFNWEPGRIDQVAAAVLVTRNPSLPSRIEDDTRGIASDAKTRLISNRLSYLLRNADDGLPELYNLNVDNKKNGPGLDSGGLLREILDIKTGLSIKSCQECLQQLKNTTPGSKSKYLKKFRDEDRTKVADAWPVGRDFVKGHLGLFGTAPNIHSCQTCSVSQQTLNRATPANHQQASQPAYWHPVMLQTAKKTSWISMDDDLITSSYYFDSAPNLRNKVAAAVLVQAEEQLPTQILEIQMDEGDGNVWIQRMMFLNKLHMLLKPLLIAKGLYRSYGSGDVIPLLEKILLSFNKHDSHVEEILAFFDPKRPGSAGSDGTMTSSSFTIEGIQTPSGTLSTSGSRPASPF